MIEKFSIAALLAVSAVAGVEDHCCEFYTSKHSNGGYAKFCLNSLDEKWQFNLNHYGLQTIASYVCGKDISFCMFPGYDYCYAGEGRIDVSQADLGDEQQWVILSSVKPERDTLMQLDQNSYARGVWVS